MSIDWLSPTFGSGVVDLGPGDVYLRGYRGDSFSARVRFRFADGTNMPIGGTWRAAIRSAPSSTEVLGEFAVSTDLDDYAVDLRLTGAQTATLPQRTVWDLENAISLIETRTWLRGGLYLDVDVTRS